MRTWQLESSKGSNHLCRDVRIHPEAIINAVPPLQGRLEVWRYGAGYSLDFSWLTVSGAYAMLATQCLDNICTSSRNDSTLLYACVLEAQRTRDHLQIITSLQRVLDKYNYNAPNGAHLPALLR